MRAKCFRSMKKNEEPHRLHVVFKGQNEVAVESFMCSWSGPVPPCYWAHVSRTEKKTFHGRTQSEHEIKCLFYYKPYFEIFMGKIFAM